jgi:hypothetical protein
VTTFLRTGTACVFAVCAGACATPSTTAPSAVVTSPAAKLLTQARATNAVVIGRSTKAEVIAALGESLVIRFDNGYEVWVYHLADEPPTGERRRATRVTADTARAGESAEFVILFDPSGVVAKTRVRPAPQTRSR